MSIWQDGKTYRVKIINQVFLNFGKVVEVNCGTVHGEFCFWTNETEDWDEEFYTDDDFVLVDDTPVYDAAKRWIMESCPELYNIIGDYLTRAFVAGYYSKNN